MSGPSGGLNVSSSRGLRVDVASSREAKTWLFVLSEVRASEASPPTLPDSAEASREIG